MRLCVCVCVCVCTHFLLVAGLFIDDTFGLLQEATAKRLQNVRVLLCGKRGGCVVVFVVVVVVAVFVSSAGVAVVC